MSRDINSPEFSRNYGFWNEDEQQRLLDSTVAIAGVGGEGFIVGLELARMGVQSFDVADPEVFEKSNINRVPGATELTVGHSKVDVFAQMVREINPDAEVRVYPEGITRENVAQVLGRAALVIDGSDLNRLDIGTVVAREARERGIPDLLPLNIGWAAVVTSFDPKSRWTFERFMGIPKGASLDEIARMRPDFSRCLPYLPTYGHLQTLQAVKEGASLPSIAPGVNAATAMSLTQAFKHLVGSGNHRGKPVWAPNVAYFDPYTLESGVIDQPRLAHYVSLAKAVLTNLFRRNPRASYTAAEREQRELAHMNARILSQVPTSSEV